MRDDGSLAFPDIGLSLLEGVDGLDYDFMPEYRPEYAPEQLADYDVVISLKPRVTAQSLEGVSRLCAIGRCGVGYDNVDLRPARSTALPFTSRPSGVVRPVAESILLLVLALSHRLLQKDRLVRQRSLGRKHPATGARAARPGSRHHWTGEYRRRSHPAAARAGCAAVPRVRSICLNAARRRNWAWSSSRSTQLLPRIGLCPGELPADAGDPRPDGRRSNSR